MNTPEEKPVRNERYHWLGAHAERRDGVDGARFALWAPNATEVSVLSDGNGWQHGSDWLTGSDSGVWSGFIPGAGVGTRYKYSLRTKDGQWVANCYDGNENFGAVEFLKQFNIHLHSGFSAAITIAEESTLCGGVSSPVYNGGLGFGFR